MTQQPEIRFVCDRCGEVESVKVNDQPAQNRARPPDGWEAIWVGNNTKEGEHLCKVCTPLFYEFMKA